MPTKVAQVIFVFVLSLLVLTLSVCTAAPMSDYLQDTEELTNRETEVGCHFIIFRSVKFKVLK